MFIDGLDDRLFRCQRDLDLPVEDESQLVDRLEIHGVMHDDANRPVLIREGHDDVFAGERFRHELDDGGRDLDFVEGDELEAMLFGLGLHDVVHLGVAQFDQGILDGALRSSGFFELIGADQPTSDENFCPIPTLGHDLRLRR